MARKLHRKKNSKPVEFVQLPRVKVPTNEMPLDLKRIRHLGEPSEVVRLQSIVGNRLTAQLLLKDDESFRATRKGQLPKDVRKSLMLTQNGVALKPRLGLNPVDRLHLQRFRERAVSISESSDLNIVRRMGREPEVMVKNLGELDGYLGRADQVIGAGVTAADVFRKPGAAEKLQSARGAMGKVRSPISKASNILQRAGQINQVVTAIIKLEKIDISKDPKGAAKAFDQLFAGVGSLGSALPSGPWTPYFTLLSSTGSFFSDMYRLFDLRTRPNTRRYREFLPK